MPRLGRAARPWLFALAGLAVAAAPVSAGNETMTFRAGCATGERAVIAAVGDLLFHNALQRQALTSTGSCKFLS